MSHKQIACMDIDWCIANTWAGVNVYRAKQGLPELQPTTNYHFFDLGEDVADYVRKLIHTPEFYRDIPPVENAVQGCHILSSHYDLMYLTARGLWADGTYSPELINITVEWLKQQGFPNSPVFFVRSAEKVSWLTQNFEWDRIAFLVEDHPDTAMRAIKEGLHTYLMDYPYNGSVKSGPYLTRVSSFKELLSYV